MNLIYINKRGRWIVKVGSDRKEIETEMSEVRLAIIDNSMVDHRPIEDLLDRSNTANFDITVFCEEPRIACDRVHLSSYFSHHTAEEPSLVCKGFYGKHGIKVLVNERAITINRQERVIHSSARRTVFHDKLITATGSYPWTPPIKGSDTQDCFVYRAIEDLNAIKSCAHRGKRGIVVGDGLLGLEAAGALKNLGIEAHVIRFAPMLMMKQLDQIGGGQLRRKVENMGVCAHTNKNTLEIVQEGVEARKTMRFAGDSELEVDFTVLSTGIRLRDKLAAQYGLDVAPHGGIVINDSCQTSDPDICAIGECTSWSSRVFGLVVPGCKMTQVAVDHILGSESAFEGADLGAKLKLLDVDIGGIDDAHGRTPGACSYIYFDGSKEIYKHLIVGKDNKTLLSVALVGDTSDYGNLLQLVLNTIELPENLDSLILPAYSGSGKLSIGVDKLPDSVQICSCLGVTKGDLIAAINKSYHAVAVLKAEAKAGTDCDGCIPLVTQVLNAELVRQGIEASNNLCEYFAYSRQELFHLIRVKGIKIFEELLAKHSRGYGYGVCKPTVGSLLISCWNEYILKPEHTPLRNSNDDSLTNIQGNGTYSMTPRSPGGEITPEGLVAVGRITRELNLYTKVTGSQYLAMFGTQKDDLPEIWHQLIRAGLETGHAYAKALRMARTCVGSTRCRYGVDDSVGLDVKLENRYKDIRTPHKMKFGVSGCTREHSEAQGRGVNIIVTEKGWSLYVCGNGGMKPRHADLLTADVDRETLIKYLDRFMMFYIRTTDKLACTAPWLENLEGGIDYLKAVIIDDKLGLGTYLEEGMARLREATVCEWAETVNTPSAQTRFKHFINSNRRDPNVQMVPEREQHHPAIPCERIPVTLMEDNA